jgi:hypothetical protein
MMRQRKSASPASRQFGDQTTADAERTQATLDGSGSQAISLDMIDFSSTARKRLRLEDGYRRNHLRAFVQRVEVAYKEVFIMGSESRTVPRFCCRF